MMRLWSQFLLTIPLIVAANRADAAVITVTFSGTFSGSSTGISGAPLTMMRANRTRRCMGGLNSIFRVAH